MLNSVERAGQTLHDGARSRNSENARAAAWHDAIADAKPIAQDSETAPASGGTGATAVDRSAERVGAPGHVQKSGPASATDRNERLHIARELVRSAGHATKADREVLEHHLASTLSLGELRKFKALGVHYVVVRGTVADYDPSLTGHPRGYPPNAKVQNLPALTIIRDGKSVSVIATHTGPGGRRLLPGKAQSSSEDAVLHETGHQINHLAGHHGRPASDERAFETAYDEDANTGPLADPYYHQAGSAGRDEAFAESNADYLRRPQWMKAEYPHLYAYFRHFYGALK